MLLNINLHIIYIFAHERCWSMADQNLAQQLLEVHEHQNSTNEDELTFQHSTMVGGT